MIPTTTRMTMNVLQIRHLLPSPGMATQKCARTSTVGETKKRSTRTGWEVVDTIDHKRGLQEE